MRVKVIYDYQIFLFQKYGGISRYFFELATRIAKKEESVANILAPAYINNYLKNADSGLLIGLSVPPIPRTVRLRNVLNREVTRFALNQLRPEVVHETYYSAERLAPKKSKILVTVHDMIHEKFGHSFSSTDPTSLLKAKSVDRADCIICVSENTRKDLLDLFNVDPRKVFVTHLGCSPQLSLQKPIKLKKNHCPYILYVGQRHLYKNFTGFLQAYALSKPLRHNFKVVCFGGIPFSEEELTLFSTYKLTIDKIQYVSGNDEALGELYANASAFVYPSLYEGFGIPPLEAMSYNCPVVCSDRSSIPEVVGEAAEFFDPYVPESIGEALTKVLYSSDRTQTLIQLGAQRVKEFTWERCAEKTCSIYSSLL